jgi:competence protein ComEA
MKRLLTFSALGMLVVLLVSPHAVRAQSATPATPATPAAPAKPATKTEAKPKAPVVKYDLNTASKDELMKLTGVDSATADKIIAARPYKSKKDLVSKKVLTQAEYDRIHGHIKVTSNTQAATKKPGR